MDRVTFSAAALLALGGSSAMIDRLLGPRQPRRTPRGPKRLTLRIVPTLEVGRCGVAFNSVPCDAHGPLFHTTLTSALMCQACVETFWDTLLDGQLDGAGRDLSTEEGIRELVAVFGISRAQAAKAVRAWRKRGGAKP